MSEIVLHDTFLNSISAKFSFDVGILCYIYGQLHVLYLQLRTPLKLFWTVESVVVVLQEKLPELL